MSAEHVPEESQALFRGEHSLLGRRSLRILASEQRSTAYEELCFLGRMHCRHRNAWYSRLLLVHLMHYDIARHRQVSALGTRSSYTIALLFWSPGLRKAPPIFWFEFLFPGTVAVCLTSRPPLSLRRTSWYFTSQPRRQAQQLGSDLMSQLSRVWNI